MPGSLANKGLQDYSGLDTNAEADNSIPAASTISRPVFIKAQRTTLSVLAPYWPHDERHGLRFPRPKGHLAPTRSAPMSTGFKRTRPPPQPNRRFATFGLEEREGQQ